MHIVKWFHHLFNPHCPECEHDSVCKNCEQLRSILAEERFEKKQLLEKLLHKDEPVQQQSYQPIELPKPRNIPWSARQQMLETEARLANKARKEIDLGLTESLENDLEIKESNAN